MSNSTRIKIGVALKPGFFKAEGAERYTTISAAAMAIAEVGGGVVDIVYLVPGRPRLPINGLLLPGGDDIDPRHYGRPDLLEEVQEANYEQDKFELEMAVWAHRNRLPTLGLCRGFQVLNVSRGGSLIPRLPRAGDHYQEAAERDPDQRRHPVHEITVAPASKLWNVVQSSTAQVNSIHRGGIDRLGHGLRATAWAEQDRIIEAFEADDGSWAHAVLFHPEDLSRLDSRWLRLFRGFVSACVGEPELEAAPSLA